MYHVFLTFAIDVDKYLCRSDLLVSKSTVPLRNTSSELLGPLCFWIDEAERFCYCAHSKRAPVAEKYWSLSTAYWTCWSCTAAAAFSFLSPACDGKSNKQILFTPAINVTWIIWLDWLKIRPRAHSAFGASTAASFACRFDTRLRDIDSFYCSRAKTAT